MVYTSLTNVKFVSIIRDALKFIDKIGDINFKNAIQ